ncbi:MAG: hypothetical protein RLZZ472_424, partial [Pseudomonadota bacterium]
MANKQVKKTVSKKDPKPTFAPVTFSEENGVRFL